jgi:hypothetical protein
VLLKKVSEIPLQIITTYINNNDAANCTERFSSVKNRMILLFIGK